jgi:hypothetical protein
MIKLVGILLLWPPLISGRPNARLSAPNKLGRETMEKLAILLALGGR